MHGISSRAYSRCSGDIGGNTMTGQVELLEAPSLWQQPEGEQLEIAQGRFFRGEDDQPEKESEVVDF
uniref:Uncharacterized protein n=4 Tax=Pseudomonas TaxID=286 RepID=A0A1V0M5V1_PSEAI|nr:Hypothetical protein [Pseudomonas aeruginosa]QOJ62463.1 Hypothetical protein [Pseudomonas aeruginosa]QOJ63025.1 Hypothetical protein [Pseudomonas aeruginosa]QOJ63578.1 Hypothetical protein [Pseudomonas aeruginosa]QOJ64112.1 Hypothetical protein [Pseudomonas aeruginosa]